MDRGTATSFSTKSERGSESHYVMDLNESAMPCPANFWRGDYQPARDAEMPLQPGGEDR